MTFTVHQNGTYCLAFFITILLQIIVLCHRDYFLKNYNNWNHKNMIAIILFLKFAGTDLIPVSLFPK